MSPPVVEAGGPLASLPRYQSASAPENTGDSVWRLLQEAKTRRGVDPQAVPAFLRHTLPPWRSLFRGIGRLPPPLPRIERASSPPGPPVDTAGAPEAPLRVQPMADARAQHLLATLSDAVRARVAQGARDVSLSGGVDSAALCAMAARHAPGHIRAWTMDVHFADETERRNAQAVANATGVERVDVPVPDAALPDLLEAAVLANETVIINARAVASFAFYAEARRQGAGILLSGAGADEVLLGNPAAIPGARTRVEEDRALADTVLPSSDPHTRHEPMPWDLAPDGANLSEEVRYASWVLRELVLPPEWGGARAHGLTLLTPYLDALFADMALALPTALLVRDDVGKWLFRHAVRDLVPDTVRLARKTPRYAHTALSSPVRTRWLELYRAWLAPDRLAPLETVDTRAVLALLERYTRLDPEDPRAGGLDRLLLRLVSLAMLHAHAENLAPCPES